MRGRTTRRILRTATVGLVLAVAAMVVPDSAVAPTEVALVKVDTADGVDVSPDVVWVLAIGSDARPGQNMLHTRGDAIQLIGMNTRTGAATAIGIPRDSWVPIPGHGSNKINAALFFGGPQAMGRAVGGLVGIQPDYVFVSRFTYFQEMVKEIGGIDVVNPRPFSDVHIKRKGFPKGKIHLSGYDALAFARIRYNLLRGDFDRSANQQRVLRGIQRRVHDRADVPGFIERGVFSVLKNMHTNLPPAELYRLAQAMAQVDPRKVTTCVVQGGIGNIGGASVVIPNVSMARSLGNQARKDATIERC